MGIYMYTKQTGKIEQHEGPQKKKKQQLLKENHVSEENVAIAEQLMIKAEHIQIQGAYVTGKQVGAEKSKILSLL